MHRDSALRGVRVCTVTRHGVRVRTVTQHDVHVCTMTQRGVCVCTLTDTHRTQAQLLESRTTCSTVRRVTAGTRASDTPALINRLTHSVTHAQIASRVASRDWQVLITLILLAARRRLPRACWPRAGKYTSMGS